MTIKEISPEDSDISVFLKTIEIEDGNDMDVDESTHQDNENEDIVEESCFPSNFHLSQNEHVKQKMNWPTLGTSPFSEFTTPGYMACAFPTLFPYGNAGVHDSRPKEVKPHQYFRHLMNYHDKRFAQHKTFRFFPYNSWLRWTALNDGNVFVRNNAEFQNLTIGAMKEMINENPSLMKSVMYQANNIKGSKAYWYARAGELRDMVEQLGLPSKFLTMSCAGGHWKDLYRLLTSDNLDNISEKERRDLVQNNPYIVDSFFQHRVTSSIKNVSVKVLEY
ncbi:tRNA(Ile)-lysidine synthase [Frankliniella fusca]|uniref:tRNA(Ile)-lysidine synthase n=1 Tax=Frankliniella fusca TaxID=407009 RepID=A0AAE1LEH9_9NEOP|nr:tRNA(Ile)-lysidine synthase [Frankliniella fusca]